VGSGVPGAVRARASQPVKVLPNPPRALLQRRHVRGVSLFASDALEILGDQGEELAELRVAGAEVAEELVAIGDVDHGGRIPRAAALAVCLLMLVANLGCAPDERWQVMRCTGLGWPGGLRADGGVAIDDRVVDCDPQLPPEMERLPADGSINLTALYNEGWRLITVTKLLDASTYVYFLEKRVKPRRPIDRLWESFRVEMTGEPEQR
jgi:hypothetical protein